MRGSVVAGVAVLTALLGAYPAVAQVPRPSLTGQLLDAATRAPVRAAVVQLAKSHRRVLTDSLGRFAFPDVPAGTCVVLASALGYENAVSSAEPGTPTVMLLTPEPVPLAAIVALSRTSTRTARGATVKVFGRDALLAAGDIPMAQFISWKVPIHRRPCRVPEVQPGTPSGVRGAATGGMVTDCIVGLHGATGPYQVMVDGQPLQYSDELWAYNTWDVGRVEVVYQRSATGVDLFGGFSRPFAFVRLYTLGYLAQVAPRVTDLCDHVTNADRMANPSLVSLCGP